MKLFDFKEKIKNKVCTAGEFAINNNLHSVITFWVSLFDVLVIQEAYFSDYFDADRYAHNQIDIRSRYKDLDYAVYVDGSLKK